MKVTTKQEFRIVVEPRALGDFGWARMEDSVFAKTVKQRERLYQERCEEIVEQIKRHVDNVSYINIEFDTVETCSFCGRQWEVEETNDWPETPKGCPACCQDAIDEWHAQQLEVKA